MWPWLRPITPKRRRGAGAAPPAAVACAGPGRGAALASAACVASAAVPATAFMNWRRPSFELGMARTLSPSAPRVKTEDVSGPRPHGLLADHPHGPGRRQVVGGLLQGQQLLRERQRLQRAAGVAVVLAVGDHPAPAA